MRIKVSIEVKSGDFIETKQVIFKMNDNLLSDVIDINSNVEILSQKPKAKARKRNTQTKAKPTLTYTKEHSTDKNKNLVSKDKEFDEFDEETCKVLSLLCESI